MYRECFLNELIVDNFAGGGGASLGIELAVGRPVDIAINHDENAIAMHKVNHPYTKHYKEDVFSINPLEVTNGRPVGIAWFSPDCRHFSKAKGGIPVEKKVRGLSWVVIKWVLSVSPRCIFLENVEEIMSWGPLSFDSSLNKFLPDKNRSGETFNAFISILTSGIPKSHPAFEECCSFLNIEPNSSDGDRISCGFGYKVDYRILKACDYGAPTIRKRFYLIARNDDKEIVFPKPCFGPGKKKYRSAKDCIDFSLPCSSIFLRKKPLANNTLRRIAKGLDKYFFKCYKPFIMEMNFDNAPQDIDKPLTTQTTANHHYLVAPFLVKYYSSGDNICPINNSLATITTLPRFALVESHLMILRNNMDCLEFSKPLPTLTTSQHFAKVDSFLFKYNPNDLVLYNWSKVRTLLNYYRNYNIADDELLLIKINSDFYFIGDIGMRMLDSEELKLCQGFPKDYIIDIESYIGKKYSKSAQIARLGNSVCPPVATALIKANCPELCYKYSINTCEDLNRVISRYSL